VNNYLALGGLFVLEAGGGFIVGSSQLGAPKWERKILKSERRVLPVAVLTRLMESAALGATLERRPPCIIIKRPASQRQNGHEAPERTWPARRRLKTGSCGGGARAAAAKITQARQATSEPDG